MQFETIAIVVFALAVLFFLFIRRRIITDLKQQNAELQRQVDKLRQVAQSQRDEITQLIATAEQERRARQMATLSAIGSQNPARSPIPRHPPNDYDPYPAAPTRSTVARKQEAATRAPTRQQDAPANTWTDPGIPYMPAIAPSPAPAPTAAYHGGGGTFDGGGASGDYGRSDSSACTSSSSSSDSSSSSSDSGSSSSSDSGSSCSND